MDEIIQLLASDPGKAIDLLMEEAMDPKTIEDLQNEYAELKRDIRDDQMGKIQVDKQIGEGENRKLVKKVKIPIPFQNKIVQAAVAFEVGNPPTLIPDESNDLTEEVISVWKGSRLNAKLMKAIELMKSELQCALLFYVEDMKETNFFTRILRPNQNKDIKCQILENKNGSMAPYFDPFGDMKAFTWKFKTDDGKVENAWIYTEERVYIYKKDKSEWVLESNKKHGFKKIPIVYMSQEKPEWYLAQAIIDRYEVAVSKHGDSNDYTGHPILKIYGKVDGAPEKDEEGKAFLIEMEETEDGKVEKMGDVDFLTYDQAPESVKLEFDTLERLINTVTNTPDLSFDKLKGLGNIAGVALRLMFLDAEIKANKNNESVNRTILERIISVIISGVITTTGTSMKSDLVDTMFDIQFNSIIPEDVKTTVETLTKAVSGKIMSVATAVKKLDATEDSEAEIALIENGSSDPGDGGSDGMGMAE